MNLMNLIHQQLQVIKKITSQSWVAMLKLSVYISLHYYVVGNYKKCSSVTMETNTGNNHTCRSTCDVTATGTTELKITLETLASSNPAICDVKAL